MADWQFGGNNIYQNMSAREKLIVLQRDQTFMKDTTTWQEEYQRQQLLAATEEDEKQETDPVKIWESIMNKDAKGFGDSSSSLYDRGLPSGMNYGRGGFALGSTAVGIQKLLMAMGRQNETKFMNEKQKELFDNITKGTVMTKDSGFDKFGMYIEGADGERYNLPERNLQKIIDQAEDRRRLYGDQGFIPTPLNLFGKYGQEELSRYAERPIEEGRTALSGTTTLVTDSSGNQTLEFTQASGDSFNRRNAIAMGRATWGKEQAQNQTIHTGGSGKGIVNHYVRNATTAEDREAVNSLINSHNSQVRELGQQAFDSGRSLDILWLRKQTENQARALSASIGARIAAERATALQFGNQLGISQNEALQILRDKSQGEQTLNDMLAFQQRLDAMSSGVV